jgi:hypothetical protein
LKFIESATTMVKVGLKFFTWKVARAKSGGWEAVREGVKAALNETRQEEVNYFLLRCTKPPLLLFNSHAPELKVGRENEQRWCYVLRRLHANFKYLVLQKMEDFK